ncbi:MAG: hypothetical protein KatS3mg129_1133 [Leptospiraceae bacterium]|nr:MAG: hypothetical protein KatS3mg129_1133 [Leptospiraceae bacterium]
MSDENKNNENKILLKEGIMKANIKNIIYDTQKVPKKPPPPLEPKKNLKKQNSKSKKS